jgi:formamidopyrimidine-DNA glycosylase
MIELPEAILLGRQMNDVLAGKTVTNVFNATHVNKFAFFNGDPLAYKSLLTGLKIRSATGQGIFVDIRFDNDMYLSICDGVKVKYNDRNSPVPDKYQLLMTFDDETFLTFTVAMYGGMYVYQNEFQNSYHRKSMEQLSALGADFTEDYFSNFLNNEKPTLSLKAFLATEQRFPGIGNGVLQDILFRAGLHPKRKLNMLTESNKNTLYQSIKEVLATMLAKGGRNTETDLFGKAGGYPTILSKNTYQQACTKCGSNIIKENFMGGTIYYCPSCQPI